ncbi:MAG: ABC transporter permease [Chthoniobacter sp.]|uniref:ABC transporter permease n=1 Tax=Chthoniobacter sp. TaxID=2510640 RepID=UPI0032AD0570
MFAFILRRFVSMLVVLFCVITLTFLLVRVAPGGPFTRERVIKPEILKQIMAKVNLDGTLWEQYTTYLGVRKNSAGKYSGLLQGDLQISLKLRDRSVSDILVQTLPISFTLGFVAFLLASVGGVWLGSLAAVRHHTPTDAGAMLAALFLISVPNFVVGPVLILVFAVKLQIFPVGQWLSWSSLVLPAITLAGPYIAYVARLMRTSMLEVLHQDFVRTAYAKGVNERRVIYQHALKVAILPVVSYLGPLAANLLTGSLVVEAIFNIPGAGPFFVNSILNQDVFLLEGVVIVYCVLLVVLNLVVDIAYTWLDRRIRLE